MRSDHKVAARSEPSPSEMAVALDKLPGDLLQAILAFLRPKEFCALRLVSKRLAKALGGTQDGAPRILNSHREDGDLQETVRLLLGAESSGQKRHLPTTTPS